MDVASVEAIAGRVEEEFARLRVLRPALASRIEGAEGIVTTHLSCRRQRVIRVRVGGDGRARFLVRSLSSASGGAVYVVEPGTWACSCPDAHRRGKGCKHALACWVLERAARPVPPREECAGCGAEGVALMAPRAGVGHGYDGPMVCQECNPRFMGAGAEEEARRQEELEAEAAALEDLERVAG